MKYRLAIFDLDGTLMDTSDGILQSVREAIKALRKPSLDEATIRTFIGPPIQWSFKEHYGITEEEALRMAATFRDLYANKYLLRAKPYEGIFELLKTLSDAGIRIAIATYKREDYALRLLRSFRFDSYADIIFGSDAEGKLRKSDIIKKCIAKAGITDLSSVVMVGDTWHDAAGAAELGISFIGVTYGFGFRPNEEVAGTALADSPQQAAKLFLQVTCDE